MVATTRSEPPPPSPGQLADHHAAGVIMRTHMYVTNNDRALIDHTRSRVASEYWPTPLPHGGELRDLVRKVVSSRGSLVRWSSRLLGRGIHVSPMSGTWLRVHEAEHDKHEAAV
jgi:hypothetical protein